MTESAPAPTRHRRRRWLLAALSTLGAVALAEIGVRMMTPAPDKHRLHRTLLDQPFLYGLDPSHPEISSQGLRDREFTIPKPDGTTRIMLLGDSVVFGVGAGIDKTMSRCVERRLADAHIEVMNAGVHGWTPYNELQWFRTQGAQFDADVVIVVFCLNDVANPYLHWDFTRGVLTGIPDAAIPNREYHDDYVLRQLEAQQAAYVSRSTFPQSWLRRSALYRKLAPLFAGGDTLTRLVDGRSWSVRITGEDSIPIDVLTDSQSKEWAWLRGMYGELRDAVANSGAEFVVASVPLATQLDPDYPFVPQDQLAGFCKELGVDYVPALTRLRGMDPDDAFLGLRAGYDDIWHPTEHGLDEIAAEIAAHLQEHVLPRLRR